ncbi:(2Fe-2S)-binding protein [uncultured Clostridium sp.]|jgi:quercetin dioxygenase-like cupin family protein/bacterioferritin-associated ferredoxin|uniref:(2Fe-2S)-binding protein n=1 Tax=uncultured Clostridium sp. TaxID=59620 RepID=UPI002617035F|nr:(2Fe-2S)-binding protein [uncultured Clostridium sp.]
MDEVKKIEFRNEETNKGFEIISLKEFFDIANQTSIAKHSRTDFYNLIFITSGEYTHEIDFLEYKVQMGEALVVSRNRIHKYSEFDNVDGYLVMFTEGFLCEFLSNENSDFKDLFKQSYMNPHIKFEELHKYSSMLERLFKTVSEMYLNFDEVMGYVVIAGILKSLGTIMFRSIFKENKSKHEKMNEIFMQFVELVEKHFSDEKTVEGYADMMHVSKKTVNLMTRRAIDISAKQYIIQQLILKMKLKLCFEQKSVSEIANELGFNEAANLTRFFKKYTSISPTKFRSMNDEINNKWIRSDSMDTNKVREEIETKVYHITADMKVPLHDHLAQDEIFYCIKGSGFGVLGDEEVKLEVGDVIVAHAGIKHSIKTDGDLYVTAVLVPSNRMVCKCKQVTYSDIRKAMTNGARTVEDIQKMTGAGTGCGKCKYLIQNIIEIKK